MSQRYVKMGLALAVGLLTLFWFANNLLNWPTAQGAVSYMLSQADQAGGYSVHLLPPIDSPPIATLVLILILAGEGAAAFLSLLGVLRMWRARGGGAGAFTQAKQAAILGSGIAVLVWFLLFQVLGGALVLMGQNESGRGVLEGAFRFAAYAFLTLIYLSLPESADRERA